MSDVVASINFLEGRVPKEAVRIVTIVTFTFAMCTVLGRFVFLLVQRKKLRLDDILLILATIFMIAGTITLLYGLDDIYKIEALSLNGAVVLVYVQGDWPQILSSYMGFNWSHFALTWLCIFFVKFSFLAFFRDLCSRLPRIELYRKIVFGFCVVICIYAILEGFVACPKLGAAAFVCATPAKIKTTLMLGASVIALDILTDVLILAIPIILLWQVKLGACQKLGIGIFLCLSAVMIMMASVRAAGMPYYNTTDNSWVFLWQQLEASAAVTTIAVTAFRSIFVQNSQRSNYYHRSWLASIPRIFKKTEDSSVDSQGLALNDALVPQAHMIGVRTVIGRDDTGSDYSKRNRNLAREADHLEPYHNGILKTTSHHIEHQPR